MEYEKINLNLNSLITLCQKIDFVDSYLCSPVYYLMTGRKGGWIYKIENTFIIAIRHPNDDDCVLIFPAVHDDKILVDLQEEKKLAKKILKENALVKYVRLARVPKYLANTCSELIVEEDLLDWKYPIHILDVEAVVFLKGKGYAQIRQRINQLKTEHCTIKDIQNEVDYTIVLNMVKSWIEEFPYDEYSEEDLIQPTKMLLSIMNSKKLKICGQIIYYKEKPAAYCIWEENKNIANAFAMAAERKIPGLAEYNIVIMCKKLLNNGIKEVNIGGSETDGLNRYKKKFSPVKSIQLYSCEINR
jgi:hypothetical protein